ncbi:ComEC/Rec2 family competence protein [Psychrobacter sp. NG25]|uniref:ComEC/Rec2 family competence protein n=1 Tax=Psychrobacter sp. NG25 TaxID=2782005 RepID=UPI00188417C3|nr:ComEC/Rec2 family competence protein [Psychrobacter sp. NG25]MBF0658653.1 ComEC/Rec2 family competence protein [Psychrobacter sp. NG25]
MYWLICSLIISAMMGVLAVSDNMPTSPLLMDIANVSIATLSLMALAIVLIILVQFNIPSVNISRSSQKSSSYSPHYPKIFFRIANHLVVAILAIGLVIGSAMQALLSHQQAEMTAVTEPMRVQALVTVEGISDSVYDVNTESGYRQVAVINHMSPLVSELTSQDLDDITADFLSNSKNSLSKNTANNDTSYGNHLDSSGSGSGSESIEYRVLLNAYPKKSLSKTSSDSDQFAKLNHLQPGDQLFMSLTLAPLATSEQALNNPSGFDSYRWLRGRHIDGVANILAVSTSNFSNGKPSNIAPTSDSYLQRLRTRIDQGRWQLRQHFYTDWSDKTTAEQQAKAVTLSLLTGDRSLINRDTKDLYQLAGISHLLAISGTHVLFLAIVLAGGAVLIFDRFCPVAYRYIPRWQVRWWVMIGAAFVYALFTGFDVPAARTAWMLLAIGLVRLTLLPISTMRVLFALAVLMAWLDPYVLWQAGYWLSFIAVALLLKYEDTSYKYRQVPVFTHQAGAYKSNAINELAKRIWMIGRRIFKLQFWLFITLLPITLLLFGKASLWGLFINLFAIGLFGWVIVPLNLLAGLFYLLLPTIADRIWALVSAIVASLHELMTWLTSLPSLSEAWLYTPVNMAILLMVLLSILPWLLPRGFISRWLALPPLTMLMMTVYANQQSLTMKPTLYILPTGDQYISAALLQYPIINSKNTNNGSVSWLFLADHRPQATRTMPSNLTVEKLSTMLEQQLGSLSINKLEGITVQSDSVGLTDTLITDDKRADINTIGSELLPLTVARLNQHLSINQYWQAGRFDRWPELQRSYKVASQSKSKSDISVQGCEQGKTWQLPNGDLSIQALTGWRTIDDDSVWDCTLAIDTGLPIQVLRYNAADPLRSAPVAVQTLPSNLSSLTPNVAETTSRLVLNADTHQRVWQMWELLCSANPLSGQVAAGQTPINPITINQTTMPSDITWLGHSASHITADVLDRQSINQIVTYDDEALEVALTMGANF